MNQIEPILSTSLGKACKCNNCGSVKEHPVSGHCFDCNTDDWLVNQEKSRLARSGPYIQTYSGRKFYPLDPRTADICIEDIAHALGNICRFTGHTHSFYSVAQHSVLVSLCVPIEHALAALLHDASEAYLGDIAKPVKFLYALRDYEKLEEVAMLTIAEKFNFAYPFHPSIKEADSRMLFTEKRDLLNVYLDWGYELEPYLFPINALPPVESKRLFLQRFEILTAKNLPSV